MIYTNTPTYPLRARIRIPELIIADAAVVGSELHSPEIKSEDELKFALQMVDEAFESVLPEFKNLVLVTILDSNKVCCLHMEDGKTLWPPVGASKLQPTTDLQPMDDIDTHGRQ